MSIRPLTIAATALVALTAAGSLATPADAAQIRFTDVEARFDNTLNGVIAREDDVFSDDAFLIWGGAYRRNGRTFYDPSYYRMETWDGLLSDGETITTGKFTHNNGVIKSGTRITRTDLWLSYSVQLIEDDGSVQDVGTFSSARSVDHFEPTNPAPDTVTGADKSRMFDVVSDLTGDTFTVRVMEWMTAAIGGVFDPIFTTQEEEQTVRWFQASVTRTSAPPPPPPPPPIPLPAGLPLLLAGLGALAWVRRKG